MANLIANTPSAPSLIWVDVVLAVGPRKVNVHRMQCPLGCSVQELLGLYPNLCTAMPAHTAIALAIWGQKAGRETVLKEGDRLEIVRPLTVDPKVARQLRFSKQGRRASGLFRL